MHAESECRKTVVKWVYQKCLFFFLILRMTRRGTASLNRFKVTDA